MNKFSYSCFSFVFFLFPALLFASGIRGTITTEEGEGLAYATIYVKETGTGTTTNEHGDYELPLSPGTYEVAYQYLGYETQVKKLTVGNDFTEVDVILRAEAIMLRPVTVHGGKEDPAYTIMRKAIGKANYHLNQLDEYSARVYVKGSGKLKDYPWLAKKALKDEGIEKDQVYVSESVSEIKYTRPNKFEERVISVYSDGKDNNTSPNQFIYGSFYQPKIGNTISPLSPQAFSYYRFVYLGTFKDRGYEVSRIKVIPRSKGDNVVEGVINIVEGWWSIHSVDVKTIVRGIQVDLNSMYAPIEDKAWMPVSFHFEIEGKILGFEFEYNYLASLSNYKIKLNPEVYVAPDSMEVVDEKLFKEEAKQIEQQAKAFQKQAKPDETLELQKRLEAGQEITSKELNKMLREYEKLERKQMKDPEVISNTLYVVDSAAYTKDSTYWASVRPVPLSHEEIVGYKKIDSLAEIARKKEAGDTLNPKHTGFKPWDILLGNTYKTGEHSNFKLHTIGGGFNTVEGFYLLYKLSYGTVFQDTNKTRLLITPTARYAFSRETLSGNLEAKLYNHVYELKVEGGRYIAQYNPDNPIWPIVNTFTTLALEKNLIKLYERDYLNVYYKRTLSPFITFYTDWYWMTRRELFNHSDLTWNDRDDVEYTPNRPVNAELANTGFAEHQALTGEISVTARPWLKFRIRNGKRYSVPESSPAFMATYKQGIAAAGSDVDFSMLDVGFKHHFTLGIRGTIDMSLHAGKFLRTAKMYFMDYKHFLGDQTPFSTADPVGSFRLLNYYRYSTADRYFTANVHYQFRKFLVTSIPIVRLTGIRENVFVNYLATPFSKNYTELGYGIDGIVRIFRLEAAAAFKDSQYSNYGFRIGIAASLGASVSFNED